MAEAALITGMGGKEPDIDADAFVAPTSVVIGEVTLAAGSSVWYQAVLRADCGPITLGPDSNIQDNCSVHTDPGFPLTVGARVSVGHNAVLHGCVIEDDVLVGMGATVLNGAHIGAGSRGGPGAVPQRIGSAVAVAGAPGGPKPGRRRSGRASGSTRPVTWSSPRPTARRTRTETRRHTRSRTPCATRSTRTRAARPCPAPAQPGPPRPPRPEGAAAPGTWARGRQLLGRRVHTTSSP
ncbi:Carnitine operon protein CaiE [Streptomyces microflavus]